MIPCLFHLLTGFDCPLCGTQRMAVALLYGHITEAFHYNPMLFCLLPVIGVLAGIYLFNKDIRPRMRVLWSDRALLLYLVLLLLWGIARNIWHI